MKGILPLLLAGSLIVIAYDSLAALFCRVSGVPYGPFAIGSFALYSIFGFLVARKSKWFVGTLAGLVVGLSDATIGWLIAWKLGPGEIHGQQPVVIGITVLLVVIAAGVFGLIGGSLALLTKNDA